MTDVFTETVPKENTNIIQISTVFATAKAVQSIAIAWDVEMADKRYFETL